MQLDDDDFARLSADSSNVKITERDFITRLLPHLVPSEDGTDTRRPVDIYVAVTGNPMRMLDVVADNDQNKILFTVPPLISPTPMNIRAAETNPNTDISELSSRFEAEITTSHPGMVIDNFVRQLVALNFTQNDAISTVYSLMWAQIYRRYNIPLERLFGAQAGDVAKALGAATPQKTDEGKGQLNDDFNSDEDFDPV